MAVFTHITEDDLKNFLRNYNFNNIDFIEGINEGIQNTNYKVGIDSEDYILTIYENISDGNDISFFLELMMHLSTNNIKCPIPVKDIEDKSIGEIKSKSSALLTFLEGKSISSIEEGHAYEIGKALAAMHTNVTNFKLKKKNDLSIDGWNGLLEANQKKLNLLEENLYINLRKELNRIENLWPRDLPSGIIHADLFPDNVLFLNNKVSGLIDFYFSCNDFFAYDLSICINAWCFNKENKFSREIFKSLLKGYQELRSLSEKELEYLPVLCSGSALRFLLTRVDNWNNSNGIDIVNYQDPKEFLNRLKFHQQINDIKGYGF